MAREIRVQRWLPGSHLEGSRLVANEDAKERIEVLARDTNVYRGADGKFHGKSYGPWRSTSHSRKAKSAKETLTHSVEDTIDQKQCLEGFDEVSSQKGSVRKENRLKAFEKDTSWTLLKKIMGWRRNAGTRGALHAEPHHELDGFVHHGAHHPFALPDDDDHEKEDELVFGSKPLPSSTSLRRMASF